MRFQLELNTDCHYNYFGKSCKVCPFYISYQFQVFIINMKNIGYLYKVFHFFLSLKMGFVYFRFTNYKIVKENRIAFWIFFYSCVGICFLWLLLIFSFFFRWEISRICLARRFGSLGQFILPVFFNFFCRENKMDGYN